MPNPRWRRPARRARPVGRTEHVYADTRYAAGTWGRERRVVIKAEVVRLKGREPRDNPRFVVTNRLESSRFVYEWIYCARGDIENRIKELLDWPADRPHELLQVPGEPVACVADRDGLRTHAGAAGCVQQGPAVPAPK